MLAGIEIRKRCGTASCTAGPHAIGPSGFCSQCNRKRRHKETMFGQPMLPPPQPLQGNSPNGVDSFSPQSAQATKKPERRPSQISAGCRFCGLAANEKVVLAHGRHHRAGCQRYSDASPPPPSNLHTKSSIYGRPTVRSPTLSSSTSAGRHMSPSRLALDAPPPSSQRYSELLANARASTIARTSTPTRLSTSPSSSSSSSSSSSGLARPPTRPVIARPGLSLHSRREPSPSRPSLAMPPPGARSRSSHSTPRSLEHAPASSAATSSSASSSSFARDPAARSRELNFTSARAYLDSPPRQHRAQSTSPPQPKAAANDPKGGCSSRGCMSSALFVQANGLCTACNTKAKIYTRADRGRDANRDSTRGSSLPLRSSRPSSSGAASGDGAPGERLNGSAFDGRLEYNYMPRRLSGVHAGPGEKPKKSAIDYQFLRLKFLLNKAVGNGVAKEEIYAHFDKDYSGDVSAEEFKEGLKNLGIFLTDAELMALMANFSDGHGGIAYQSFIDAVGLGNGGDGPISNPMTRDSHHHEPLKSGRSPSSSAHAPPPLPPSHNPSPGDESDLEKLVRTVHNEMNRLAKGASGKLNFKKVFKELDKDGDGSLTMGELIEGLSHMGFNLDFKQAKDVAKVFDADGSGTIDYAEFVKFCEHDDLAEAVQVSKNVVEKKTYGSILKKKLSDDELEELFADIHTEMNRLARVAGGPPKFDAVFARLDEDGGGEVEVAEFVSGLSELGFNLSSTQVGQIIKVFDTDGSGSIDYHEFVRLCETNNFKEAVSSAKVAKKKKKAKKEREADDDGGAPAPAAAAASGGGSKKDKGKDNEKALNDFEMNELVSTVHKALNKMAKNRNGPPQFKRVFSSLDKDGSGLLNIDELIKALGDMSIVLPDKHLSQVSKVFDANGDGNIDYEEFLKFCSSKDISEAIRLSKNVKVKKR